MTGLDHYRGDEYQRLWRAARRSLEISGSADTGSVSIPDPSEAERAAIIGLTGTHRSANATRVTARLADLDAALRRTTGRLAEVLGILGGPLRNKPAERSAAILARTTILAQLQASPLHDKHPWFRE